MVQFKSSFRIFIYFIVLNNRKKISSKNLENRRFNCKKLNFFIKILNKVYQLFSLIIFQKNFFRFLFSTLDSIKLGMDFEKY